MRTLTGGLVVIGGCLAFGLSAIAEAINRSADAYKQGCVGAIGLVILGLIMIYGSWPRAKQKKPKKVPRNAASDLA